jgi:hypothetical protein
MDPVAELRGFVRSVPSEWLLEGDAFTRYRVLTDLLGRCGDTGEVKAARSAIGKDRRVRALLANRNADGYWGRPSDIFTWWPKKDTTFWVLGLLADLGLTRTSRRIAGACEYVLDTQLDSGAFGWAPPPTPADCFTGILTEALAKLGYHYDPRLKKAYKWMLGRQRLDGGFWCKKTGLPGGPRQHDPSCAFGTLCVLAALVQSDQFKDGQAARRAIEFLLSCWQKRGKIRYAGHDSQVGHGWDRLKYPFTDYKILKYLDAISQCPSVRRHPGLLRIASLLPGKADHDGRFYAESIHRVWSAFDFGQKKVPSRWITLLAYRILRRLTQPNT